MGQGGVRLVRIGKPGRSFGELAEQQPSRETETVNRSGTANKAFIASGVSVAVAIPASIALQTPDLPGLVLVATGTVATLLARRNLRERVFSIMAALVLLIAALLALHALWHRLGMSHEWLGLPYLGTVVAYCALALSLGLRLLRRETRLPPG